MLREVGATLNNRSFVVLAISGMFMNVSLGLKTALVRTGKFRPETLELNDAVPDVVLSSVAQLPGWLEQPR